MEIKKTEKLTYSAAEVAEMLGIGKSLLYQLLSAGTIPSIQLGTRRIIPKEQFHNWLNGSDKES